MSDCCIPCYCPECGPEDGKLRLPLDNVAAYTCPGCDAEYTREGLMSIRDAAVSAWDKAIKLLDAAIAISQEVV